MANKFTEEHTKYIHYDSSELTLTAHLSLFKRAIDEFRKVKNGISIVFTY